MFKRTPYGFGYDAMSMLMADGASINRFPSTAAGWASLGIAQPTYIFPLQETSGNLVDTVAAEVLTPSGTGGPDYAITGGYPGRVGLRFDGTNQQAPHASSAFLDFDGSASFTVAVGFYMSTTPAATRGVTGKRNSAGALEGYACSVTTNGYPSMAVDAGVTAVALTGTQNVCNAASHGIMYVVDRAAQVMRIHTDLEDATSATISGVGTLTNTATFRLGNIPGTASSASEGMILWYCAIWSGTALTAADHLKWWGS
jgi:hypothetical protein